MVPEQVERGAIDGAILDALRSATEGRHVAIDSLLGLRRPFDRSHYARVLQGFDGFLSVWEPRLLRALPPRLHPWFTDGRRAVLARRDLGALGVPTLSWQASVPAIAGLPEALGSLYVMEGSALGGQFIAAQVRRHLDLSPDNGAAYFHGCGAGTAARWRGFQRLLARELDGDAGGQARAMDAAAATFDALIGTFGTLLHERTAA
jgi:heme oxygenase